MRIRPTFFIIAVIALTFLACHLAKMRLATDAEAAGQISTSKPPERIVSMAPSVTETIFALGLGDRLVGVSRFSNYPPEAAKIASCGGIMDPNIEATVALKPDLVVMLRGNDSLKPAFARLGINTLVVDHKTVEGVLESMPDIGRVCGDPSGADRIVTDLRNRMDRVRRKTAGLPRPKVLVSIDRKHNVGRLQDGFIVGSDGYFDYMITAAGGQNVFGDQSIRYPVVSTESIIKANPEIIVDISYDTGGDSTSAGAESASDWRATGVTAVTTGRVYCLGKDFSVVPGPRFILQLEKLAKLLHPEIDWSK